MLQEELRQLRSLASRPGSLDRLESLLIDHESQKQQQEPWLAMDLLRCYQAIWLNLPEPVRDGRDPNTNKVLDRVQRRMKQKTSSFPDLLLNDPLRPALIDPQTNQEISYAKLRGFIQTFDLGLPCPAQGRPKVAVMLPNGPILALAVLAIANRYTMIPMARTVAPEQLKAEVDAVEADAFLMLDADVSKVQLDLDVPIFAVHPQPDLTFTVTSTSTTPTTTQTLPDNGPDDVAVLLFTSGTSGKKKLVPITTYNLFAGAVFTMDSVGLDDSSRCSNMMPLHHIGGMIRSLYAPMLAGGTTICCASFDPNLFWDVVEQWSPTWYYATPTMHQMILSESEHRPEAVRQSVIRFIINAGGGLPATLAVQLHEVFRCVVLPSYGMTECAPIASPPTDYKLEREGTSGRPCGPDVAILDGGAPAKRSPNGTTGRICVRGFPVFPGYLTEDGINKGAFDENGWFDTGDLGHLDDEGFLFITGRSKEVINRGGEIISPIEVENAILSAARDPTSILYGRITETLAFSTPHDVLQEAVGAVIVTAPGKARPDLRQVTAALHDRLHQPKLPIMLVYMDDGVPKSNNKLQRIRLSQRLGIETLSDDVPLAERHYEAKCPPQGTALTVSIPHTRCLIDGRQIQPQLANISGLPDMVMRHNPTDGFPQAVFFHSSESVLTVSELAQSLRPLVHGYLIPSSIKLLPGPIPIDMHGYVDEKAVDDAIRSLNPTASDSLSTEYRVRELFAQALNQAVEDVSSATDFFAAGGDSLSAGRLISTLRREFDIRLSGDVLFLNSTVGDITAIVDAACAKKNPDDATPLELPGCTKTHSSTNPILLLIQLIPMLVFFPMRVGLQWTIFVFVMGETARRFPPDDLLIGRLVHIVLVGLASRIAINAIAPVAGILFKWLVIGRYQAGMHPMWGVYHTRWWLTQKAIRIAGKGIFNYFDWSRVLYYRALGAHIGRNVKIHEHASLGEYDLIHLDANVVLENCIVRPFAVERNTSMLLQPIHIGADAAIGLRTVVAPGAVIAPNTCIGPNSSSWETDSADAENRDLNSAAIAAPHWIWSILLIEPLGLLAGFMFRLPWLAGLVPIVMHFPLAGNDMLRVIVFWFTNPTRIGWHILARIYYAVAGPIVWFVAVLIVKRLLDLTCGRSQTGPISKMSTRQKVRQAALFKLIPGGSLSPLTRLIGKHYELVSVAIRLLGGRVGKRIYWPSVGPGIQDFDLVEVGNDVVFGSRSYLVTSDGSGRERVVISDGAMLGDRAVVLPGVTIGEMAMVGSGSLLRRNGFYPPDTVWTGSRKGNAIQFPTISTQMDKMSPGSSSPDEKASLPRDTTRPFGRAFYQGMANFFVISIPGIVCYSTLMAIISTVWRLLGVLSGLLVLGHCLKQEYRALDREWWQPFSVYGLVTAVVAAVSFAQTIIGLAVVLAAKWTVMGRRTEGAYHWDRSSYNQRWQFFLNIESLIKDSYRGIGVLPMISGTAYLTWYYRLMGASIGKDCALLANGDPNIMLTEPDMVTLGDRVAVDDASLVCHLNTRGEFELHPLVVGDRSIMRTGSRLMSGSSMGSDACLLEHTLVLSGDHVDDGGAMQGWPAEPFDGKRAL